MEFINCFGSDDDEYAEQNSRKTQSTYNRELANKYKENGMAKNPNDKLVKKKVKDIVLDTEDVKILEYKEFEKERYYGKIEYKLKLNNTSEKRMEKLITQMLFRIREGQGECFYVIGVEDNGNPLGLKQDELEESEKILYLMVKKIKAQMTIMNHRKGQEGLIAEIHIIKEDLKLKDILEIRIGLVGEAGCGKSTLVGCLLTNMRDNGKGLTRNNVFRHKHEIICGKSSSFSHQIIGFDEKGKITNHSSFTTLSWPEIIDKSTKIINFYDLGGSETSMKTTVKTLSPNYIDYISLVISASSKISDETTLFLNMALALDLPIFIIVTKIDLVEDLSGFLSNLNFLIKQQKKMKNPLVVKSKQDIVMFSKMLKESIIPIFLMSNVKGEGLDLFLNFLNVLPMKQDIDDINIFKNRVNLLNLVRYPRYFQRRKPDHLSWYSSQRQNLPRI